MGEHGLGAVEAQFVGVAVGAVVGHGAAGDRVAAPAVQGAQLAVVVVVDLPALIQIQRYLVELVGGQGQARAPVGAAAFHRGRAPAADHAAVVKRQIRRPALVDAAAHGQAQQAIGQRPGQVDVGSGGGSVVAVLVEGVVEAERARPAAGHAAGDDVDHAADRIRAVQGGHRPADHLDPLDRGQRRHEAVGGLPEAVGRDVAAVVLAAAVDQHQGVGTGHAADADVQAAGLAGALADVHAFHFAQRFGQVAELLALQLLAGDHADAGRGVGDLLLEARGGHHHGVEVDRVGRGGRLGQGGEGGQQQGGGQDGTAGEERNGGAAGTHQRQLQGLGRPALAAADRRETGCGDRARGDVFAGGCEL